MADTLVAVSYFDTGKDSLASLLAIYDPAFARFSPGLYTLAEEVELARELGKKFFYPGYILPGFSQFDYKMRIGQVQYLPAAGRWKPMPPPGELPLQITDELAAKTAELEAVLQQWNIPSRRKVYPFFSLGYLLYPDDYMCAPLLLEIRKPVRKGLIMIALYDPDEQIFELCLCRHDPESLDMLGYQEWEYSPGFFEKGKLMLLQKEKTLLVSSSPEEIAVAIGDSMKH
ncbi:MAG: GNAT family N-acetyltransferase [Bacteroidetes bacterium]|nr:MAG: GNAT family N-acetyltransferase [Bacteroidota bacterium]